MKLSLSKRTVCPPDGFRYVFPETGYTVHAWDYQTWIANARNHLRANQMPVPDDIAATMEDQLCQTLEPGWCNYDDPNRPRPSTVMGWGDVQHGLETFTKWITHGAQFVSKNEANRRALICSRCYLNVQVSGCLGCHKAVQQIVKNCETKYDFALKGCAVCKCLLRAKVHFPISTLDTQSDKLQQMYPEFCWLKKGGQNFKP